MAMKNRKTIVAVFLLAACLLIGVGYAAVTDTFVFNGNATVSEQGATDALNEQVVLKGVVLDGPGGINVVSDALLSSTDNKYTASCNVAQDTASYHIYSLKQKDDVQTVTFRIANEGDIAAVIKVAATNAATNDNSTYFDVSYSLADGSSTTLAAGGSIDVTVTVKLLATPKAETTGAFTFTFTAERLDA